jgi:hypothetical protein
MGMNGKRCGNCRHLDPSSASDIGGLRIARCRHPSGVRIGSTPIRDDYVELDAYCTDHAVRARPGKPAGGCHV